MSEVWSHWYAAASLSAPILVLVVSCSLWPFVTWGLKTQSHQIIDVTSSRSYERWLHRFALNNNCSVNKQYRSIQSVIPLLFVYIPSGMGVSLPLFITGERKGGPDLWFTCISSFPALDAVVIILLMRDYRDGLLTMVFRRPRVRLTKPKHLTPQSTWNEYHDFCSFSITW